MNARLEERARKVRARATRRSFEYRQRNLAAGVWSRLRRVLAGAERAYAISEEAAAALLAEGHAPHPVGLELEPPRTILLLSRDRAAAVPGAREIEIRMSAELLAARCLVLVPFPDGL